MNIMQNRNDTELAVTLEGRLDTTTAPQLEQSLKSALPGVKTLILDFSALDYLSSAGLRVLLATQKAMRRQGKMVIRHVNETIMLFFAARGFTYPLTFSQ